MPMVKMFVVFLLLVTGQTHELVYYKVFDTVGECELGKPEALEAFDDFLRRNGLGLEHVQDLKLECRGEDAVDDEEKAFNALHNTLAEMVRQGGIGAAGNKSKIAERNDNIIRETRPRVG